MRLKHRENMLNFHMLTSRDGNLWIFKTSFCEIDYVEPSQANCSKGKEFNSESTLSARFPDNDECAISKAYHAAWKMLIDQKLVFQTNGNRLSGYHVRHMLSSGKMLHFQTVGWWRSFVRLSVWCSTHTQRENVEHSDVHCSRWRMIAFKSLFFKIEIVDHWIANPFPTPPGHVVSNSVQSSKCILLHPSWGGRARSSSIRFRLFYSCFGVVGFHCSNIKKR